MCDGAFLVCISWYLLSFAIALAVSTSDLIWADLASGRLAVYTVHERFGE